jgi:predicted enzyme related to lactoylglutathione lyase
MADTPSTPAVGSVGWIDLTVSNAVELRDFYSAVIGWTPTPLDMGGYADFVMQAPGAEAPQAGVCHARGQNADIPPVWLVYVLVADLDTSLAACTARGGTILSGPRGAGDGARFAVIRDPAGAVLALHQATGNVPP